MNLEKKTTEKLEGELKGLTIVNGALIGVLGLLFIVCIYGFRIRDAQGIFGIIITLATALSIMIPINMRNLKKIKYELESRKSKAKL